MTALVQLEPLRRTVELTIDDEKVQVPEGITIFEACRQRGTAIPTLCYLETLHPVNVCRVCVVEVEGSRVLVPSCARKVEPGMVVRTNSERVRHSRKMVIEFLASSVDLSTTPDAAEWLREYQAAPERYGPPAPASAGGPSRQPAAGPPRAAGSGLSRDGRPADQGRQRALRARLRQVRPVLQVRGGLWEGLQNTFALTVAGRGFDARISTEFAVALPESACVYCGNCIAVCPTGALMFKTEYDHRQRRHLGRIAADRDPDGVSVLRRRLQPGAARAGQRDRAGDLAAGPRGDPRQSLHQGPVWLEIRAESRVRSRRERACGDRDRISS